MKLTLIAGARPNFMKIAPIIHAIENLKRELSNIDIRILENEIEDYSKKTVFKDNIFIKYRLVHTGQHYDKNMSDSFFRDLNIPEPDVNLGCSGGTQAEQAASIMIAFEKELVANPADLVMVVGDVTSTMACSIVAKKLNTKVAHVEAGIRSFDLSMPEEINRMVTDCLSDYFFTTSEFANENLKLAGIPNERIFFVGNVMIDTLLANRHRFRRPLFFNEFGLKRKEYIVLTLHRPANVDEELKLKGLLDAILNSSRNIPIIFPVHPRTAKIITGLELNSDAKPVEGYNIQRIKNLFLTEPMGYLEFNYLVENSKVVITDSGGITEETTVMGIPCITLRNNTERPETITIGTNELIGTDPVSIKPYLNKVFSGTWKKGNIPKYWDGLAANRIVEYLKMIFLN